MKILVFTLVILLAALSVRAVDDKNAAVLEAVDALQLTEAQKEPFGEVMQAFFSDVRNAVRREFQKANGRDKRKAIRKRIAALFAELDEPVGEILRHDQWLAYLKYKKAVADHIRESGVVARN